MRPVVISLVALGLLAGCSENTWRRSSLEHVVKDGREMTVSWIRMQSDVLDLTVEEKPFFRGDAPPDQPLLDRATARLAAEEVVADRCPAKFVPLDPPGTIGNRVHTFRYRCVP